MALTGEILESVSFLGTVQHTNYRDQGSNHRSCLQYLLGCGCQYVCVTSRDGSSYAFLGICWGSHWNDGHTKCKICLRPEEVLSESKAWWLGWVKTSGPRGEPPPHMPNNYSLILTLTVGGLDEPFTSKGLLAKSQKGSDSSCMLEEAMARCFGFFLLFTTSIIFIIISRARSLSGIHSRVLWEIFDYISFSENSQPCFGPVVVAGVCISSKYFL